MCIGLPMQVIQAAPGCALCEGMGIRREVDTLLVGDQPEGAWLLVFLNSAREVISAQDARQITDAVKAVELAMTAPEHGSHPERLQTIDTLFADLINREPEKPPSLIALEQSRHQPNGD